MRRERGMERFLRVGVVPHHLHDLPDRCLVIAEEACVLGIFAGCGREARLRLGEGVFEVRDASAEGGGVGIGVLRGGAVGCCASL